MKTVHGHQRPYLGIGARYAAAQARIRAAGTIGAHAAAVAFYRDRIEAFEARLAERVREAGRMAAHVASLVVEARRLGLSDQELEAYVAKNTEFDAFASLTEAQMQRCREFDERVRAEAAEYDAQRLALSGQAPTQQQSPVNPRENTRGH